ncbi:hypothetical protein CDAR_448551 [Caerostris darwini]|uniref:Uncharacterized protein n=1 Tax=Caerostris darwini TaxID=1538125 RepID=A0AAV4QNM8_9ARAC|nr:hypothetical protein CDAR_448551 [Caerostris darwini]
MKPFPDVLIALNLSGTLIFAFYPWQEYGNLRFEFHLSDFKSKNSGAKEFHSIRPTRAGAHPLIRTLLEDPDGAFMSTHSSVGAFIEVLLLWEVCGKIQEFHLANQILTVDDAVLVSWPIEMEEEVVGKIFEIIDGKDASFNYLFGNILEWFVAGCNKDNYVLSA